MWDALWWGDNLMEARILPVADVMAWGNIQTPAMGLLAGAAWPMLTGRHGQRIFLLSILAGAGVWRLLGPYIGHKSALGPDKWAGGICRQTTTSSCSAAAAATALEAVGIHSSEREMCDLCLTHVDGTTALGLYRGLKLKTATSQWDVRVVMCDAGELAHQPMPMIISITDPGAVSGLLSVGAGHSIVLFGFEEDGRARVGDPFTGRQIWSTGEMSRLYQGSGMALVHLAH